MRNMASVPQWMALWCVLVTIICLSSTYGASLHKKAQLVDSKEDLGEHLHVRSRSLRKMAKRHALAKAPILLENDDEHFQLTVEDYDEKRGVDKIVKRVQRSATHNDDGSGDVDDTFTTASPEEDGSGAIFGEDLTTAAAEATTEELKEVEEEIIVPVDASNAGLMPKLKRPEATSAPELEATTAEGNGTDTGSMTSDPMSKSSMRMAIIIAAIVGFWILLAPVICIVCRYRDRKNDKLNKKNKDAANHNILTPASEKPVTNGDVPEKYTKIDPDSKNPANDVWESRQLNGKEPHHSQATRV